MAQKYLKMTIGLPFSGKSQLAEEYKSKGWRIIERDAIMEEILGTKEFNERCTQKFRENNVNEKDASAVYDVKNDVMIEMIAERIKKIVLTDVGGDRFFYDGTNLQAKSRAPILDLNKEGVDISGVYLKVPIGEIIKRAEKVYQQEERRGQFNERAIKNLELMASLFDEPKKSEGFSEIEIQDIDKEARKELIGEFKLNR